MRKLLSLLTVLLFSVAAFAQVRTVAGKVLDGRGSPIPFATVSIKGTNNAVVSDADGDFSVRVNTGAVLVITALGYTAQEIPVGNAATLEVILVQNTAEMDEVVVTGAYNIKRTARSTSYNAQVVTGEDLNVIRQTNINNALAGKVSGIQVRSQSAAALGRSGDIRLRGESGLGGGEGIIYVVDGTILPNSDDINMDDVETLNVLQGPAASALFGPQGANGAIVITLKKGRKNQRGIGVDVNIGANIERIAVLPNYQNSYAGGAASDLMKYSWQPNHPEEWKALDGKYYHDYNDDASWGPRMLGQEYIPWYAWYGGHNRSYQTANLVAQPNNARDYFNTGVVLNNTVSFTKVTDQMNLRFSYGNVDIKGLIPTTGQKRNTFNFNGSINLNKNLIVGANITYVTQIVNGDINDGYSNQSTGSFNQWFHRHLDMDIVKELRGLRTPSGIYASWNKSNPTSYDPANERNFYAANYWYNFYTFMDLADVKNSRDRLYGDVSLTYKINSDFTIKGTYRKQQNNVWFESKFSSDLAFSGLQTTGNESRARGYYATNQSYSNRQNVEFLANYTKTFGDFNVNVNLGSDFFSWTSKSLAANTNNGLNVPNLFTLGNSRDQATVSNGRTREKYRAVFATGDVGYKNWLFLNATLRNDWFSTLPTVANDVLSKSFGVSAVFSDLVELNWLSFGKVRASWGEIPKALGTSATSFGAYRYPGFAYGVGQFQWNGNFLMGTPDQLVDSAIRGAVATQKEIGIELRFLRDRLGITATYWDGTERDIPQAVTINGASGFTSRLINTAEIAKKGIELQFMARPIWLNNFKWELGATYARLLENKVVRLAEGVERISIQGAWGTTAPYMVHKVGEDWGQMYGNGMKRIDGQPVLGADGLYVNDPNVYFGSVLPKYTGGVQNMFRILNDFTVNVNIDYQYGGKFFSLSDMWGSYSGLTARTATVNDKGNPIRDAVADGGGMHVFGVDADGKPVDYYVEAQDYFHGMYSKLAFDEFIYDLSFIKIREISVGYDLPVGKWGISKWAQRANLSLVARNPVLLYAQTKDFDPAEIANISGETGQLPGTRGFGFNLRVGF